MPDIFRTMIITASNAPLARELAASFGPGGSGMWQTPLSADGTEPATHFISSGYIPEAFAYMVPSQVWAQDENGDWVMTGSDPGNPVAVYEAATAQGVVTTLADVEAVFATADVTDEEPFAAMGRLGLQIVQPPIDF
jgi:hypothetical protein